jgi:hypothetical protein
VEQPVSLVLDAMARQLHVEVHRQSERLYFVGDLRPEDRAVLVRRVRGLEQQEIKQAVGTIVGGGTSVKAFPDGLLVVADKAAVLSRVEELIQGIESAGRPAWAVQLFLVTMTDDDLAEMGFDINPSVDVAVSYASAAAAGVPAVELSSGLEAVLKAARERSTMRLVAEPFFYMVDGDKAEYNRVRILAVPTSTITETGNFLTTGYQPFQAGTTVHVGIREVGERAVLLACDVTLSDLRNVTAEGFPESDSRQYQTKALCHTGGVYLLGSINLEERRRSRGNWLHLGRSTDTGREVMQIWCRCVAVNPDGGAIR